MPWGLPALLASALLAVLVFGLGAGLGPAGFGDVVAVLAAAGLLAGFAVLGAAVEVLFEEPPAVRPLDGPLVWV
jgi:hypothetical protein